MKKIETAGSNFANILRKNNTGKFKYLPDWLLYKSNRLDKEANGKTVKYQRYKRGSIVFVNFGVNMGYELSGNHFAIVLNKDDNQFNGVLTVLPLSSKKKKHYLELGRTILSAASKKIINDVETLENKALAYSEKGERTQEEYDELKVSLQQMKTVIERYETLNEVTYAMVGSITTVSKFKILKPINKYDPIGKIKVRDLTLNVIDLFIVNQYTSLLNCMDDSKLKERFGKNQDDVI